jgi:hypothetical protein
LVERNLVEPDFDRTEFGITQFWSKQDFARTGLWYLNFGRTDFVIKDFGRTDFVIKDFGRTEFGRTNFGRR